MLKPDVVIILPQRQGRKGVKVQPELALFHPCSKAAKLWAEEVFSAYPSWKGTPMSPAFSMGQANNVIDTLTERGLRVFVFE